MPDARMLAPVLRDWLRRRFRTRPIDPATYSSIKRESDYYVVDRVAGYFHRPSAYRKYVWPEHSRGYIEARTNNLGFRRDVPTSRAKPAGALRVLVTGDSHTDGMVFNAESFPSLLESQWNTSGRRRVEVLNGGAGYFGPHNYLWILEKFADLRPDVFVVALYGGNDFVDAARQLEWTQRLSHRGNYLAALKEALPGNEGAIWQAFNQILYFKENPSMAVRALEFTQDQFKAMRELCVRRSIQFFVALLPSKPEIEWDHDRANLADLKRRLGLLDSDLKINTDLRERLGEWFKSQGIASWDAESHLRVRREPQYWRADYHLNVAGHRSIAEGLFERIASGR